MVVHAENKSYLNTFWKLPTRLAFIDGGHDYEMVTDDIKAIIPHITENGGMLFHDYYWEDVPDVKQAVNDFFDCYDERRFHAYGFPAGNNMHGFLFVQFD